MSDLSPAPVLVLGIGNTLLGDDGVGVHLVSRLAVWCRRWHGAVETVEGGTQGLSLLGTIAGRRSLILLDAIALGYRPGTVHVREDKEVLALCSRSTTAHEGNAGELLAAAHLIGELPARIFLVGIEPGCFDSGAGFSAPVQTAIPAALRAARQAIERELNIGQD